MLRHGRLLRRPAPSAGLPLGCQPTRALWRPAADLFSWFRPANGSTDEAAAPSSAEGVASSKSSVAEPASPLKDEQSSANADLSATERRLFPTALDDVDETQFQAGTDALHAFSRSLGTSSSVAKADAVWRVLNSYEPFVVDQGRVRALAIKDKPTGDEQQQQSTSSNGASLPVLQMIPAAAFCTLFPAAFKRQWLLAKSESPDVKGDVLVLNETAVVSWMMDLHLRLKNPKGAINIFENYRHGRHAHIEQALEALQLSDNQDATADSDGDDRPTRIEKKRTWLYLTTKLSVDVHRKYVIALEGTNSYSKIVAMLRDREKRLDYCTSVPVLRALIYGCISEKEGVLARLAIDDFSDSLPSHVIPIQVYEAAIRANTIGQPRTENDLNNALGIMRRMRNDAGYLLHPSIWSTLFNSGIYLSQPDRALSVFKTYADNYIRPNQRHFLNAFRTACRFDEYETVIEMAEFWLAHTKKTDKPTKIVSEAINTVLWEMLKRTPTVAHVKRVLLLMEERNVTAGAIVLRRAVTKLLENEDGSKLPHDLIRASLEFWERVPSVMVRQGFLIHLLLEHSLQQHWEDECTYLVGLAMDEDKIDVPQNSLTKYMGANEIRGRFDENVALGERLAAERTPEQLGQTFFELFAMSYLKLERFDKVEELEKKFELTKKFPQSESVATSVRDAAANR